MSKLKSIWRALTTKWIDTRVADPKDYLLVRDINPEEAVLHEALAITEERRKYITSLLGRYMEETGDTAHAMSEVSKHLVHANELFYCSYVMCSMVESKNKVGGLIDLLLGGRPKDKGRPPQE